MVVFSVFTELLLTNKNNRGRGKTIIATAREFLGIIYKTLKNDWVFEDFPNFVIANT